MPNVLENMECNASYMVVTYVVVFEVTAIKRKACSHAKCTFCCTSGKVLVTLQGVNTQKAINDRAYTRRALREHCAKMLLSRAVLDDAGYEAIVHPRRVWTLIVDAATQRNFELPRLKGRKPKALTNRLMFGSARSSSLCALTALVPSRSSSTTRITTAPT